MISRIYVDNFRTLLNFEMKLDQTNLIFGPNGSGKSSVFSVLRRLQQFIKGDCRIDGAFAASDLTRWQDMKLQHFELDVSTVEGVFFYKLVIEHLENGEKCRVKEERLSDSGGLLFERKLDEVRLFRDNYSEGPSYPFDWTLSALATLQARPDNKKLTAFREQIDSMLIASIVPMLMEKGSQEEASQLDKYMKNFVSWYRRVSQENMGAMFDLFNALKDALPGFASFSFTEAGPDAKALKVLFDNPNGSKSKSVYDFSELSDGQRALIALYTLIYSVKNRHLLLFLDEPDNFVSLQEIQPWFHDLMDSCGENFDQAVLISHHPEIINGMGNTRGRWFSRNEDGATRVKESITIEDESLALSEICARGWDQ